MDTSGHKQVVQESFNTQAEAYAARPVISDRERLARLVEAVAPAPQARVLDVATGPGYLALEFGERCHEVVGVDLTPGPLAIAERLRRERGRDNVRFQASDADRLPFADGEFDVAVCRFAVHHFPEPRRVIGEMARVCHAGGTVAIEDIIGSEAPERREFQDRFERLRDPSHARALAVSELLGLFRESRLELLRVYSGQLVHNLEGWMAVTQTPPARAAEVRRMIQEDAARDLSGCRPFQSKDGWHFHQLTVALVARKLG